MPRIGIPELIVILLVLIFACVGLVVSCVWIVKQIRAARKNYKAALEDDARPGKRQS